jgi:hypothetical protein
LGNGLIRQKARGKEPGPLLRRTALIAADNGNIGIDAQTALDIRGISAKAFVSTETGQSDKGGLHDEWQVRIDPNILEGCSGRRLFLREFDKFTGLEFSIGVQIGFDQVLIARGGIDKSIHDNDFILCLGVGYRYR